jgi:hypothetical protein
MTGPTDPWARPEPGGGDARAGTGGAAARAGTGGAPAVGAAGQPSPVDRFRAGAVTGGTAWTPRDPDQEDVLEFGAPQRTPAQRRRMMWWFGGAAGLVLLAGIVVVALLVSSGSGVVRRQADPPPDNRAPLARMCPPPTAAPRPGPALAVPPGPRTVDAESGISYRAYPAPWEPWTTTWTGGTLQLSYRTGQHFVTETYPGGEYHASILSSSVPAATNDALSLDLRCAGRQVAADVRTQYYPQPNTMDLIRDSAATLGGRPAWVTVFRLHFHTEGLKATDELVGVACVDVGRPRAAVLYVSIPGTHRQYDHVVDEVIASVRPT